MNNRKRRAKMAMLSMVILSFLIIMPFNLSFAKDFPTRPINIVVPWAAGGEADMASRVAAQYISKFLGQPVIVLNKPGGAIAVGADYFLHQPADGYNLFCAGATLGLAPKMQKMPFTLSDFTGLVQIQESKCVILVKKDAPWGNFKDFVNDALKRPGQIRYGVPGMANVQTFWWEYLKFQAGMNIVAVPYAGDANVIPALLKGDIHAGLHDTPLAIPHIKGGTMKALAISERDEEFPGVATFGEQGFKGNYGMWRALSVRKGTAESTYKILENACQKMLSEEGYANALKRMGSYPGKMTGSRFIQFVLEEDKLYSQIIERMPKK